MTGLFYYVLTRFSRRTSTAIKTAKADVLKLSNVSGKYYCMTTQLDNMIRDMYPQSGVQAREAIYKIIAPSIAPTPKSDTRIDFSLYDAYLSPKFKKEYARKASYFVSFDYLISGSKSISDIVPLYTYIFDPVEDTIENATNAYRIGLFLMFLELAIFKTVTDIMDEYNSRGSQGLVGDYFDVADKGDYVMSLMSAAIDELMAMEFSKIKSLGCNISLSGSKITIKVTQGSEITNTNLLSAIISLYAKIIK